MRKTDVSKISIFSERKFEEMHYLWRAKMYKVYLGERLHWHYRLQLSFVYKTVPQISFKLCFSGDKKLLSEVLRKWGWFRDTMNVSLNILAKNQNFKKLKNCFVDERAMIKTTLISSCHWKTCVPFCLPKKILENALLTLKVN